MKEEIERKRKKELWGICILVRLGSMWVVLAEKLLYS